MIEEPRQFDSKTDDKYKQSRNTGFSLTVLTALPGSCKNVQDKIPEQEKKASIAFGCYSNDD